MSPQRRTALVSVAAAAALIALKLATGLATHSLGLVSEAIHSGTDLVAAFFGATAKFTCLEGFAGCKFNFEYSSPDPTLRFRHWQDKGTNGVSEQFVGDIATS